MASTDCDTPDVARSVERLLSQLTALGAEFHPDIKLRCNKGHVSVEASCDRESRDVLMAIPQAALLFMDRVKLGISGDDLCVSDFAPDVTPEQRQLWETVLEVFNLSGKLREYRRASPWVMFQDDPEPVHRMVQMRKSPKMQKFARYLAGRNFETLALEGLFGTRVGAFKNPQSKSSRSVLMPVIDFMNHDYRAYPYLHQSSSDLGQRLCVTHCRPRSQSDEAFVRYGRFDAFDIYFLYAYVDEVTPFVRAAPVEITLPGFGRIIVQGRITHANTAKLSGAAARLATFMPVAKRRGPQLVELTELIIPCGESPDQLRSVLTKVIRDMAPDLDDEGLVELVEQAEREVLATTEAHYNELRQYLDNYRSSADISAALAQAGNVAEVQLSKLRRYAYA